MVDPERARQWRAQRHRAGAGDQSRVYAYARACPQPAGRPSRPVVRLAGGVGRDVGHAAERPARAARSRGAARVSFYPSQSRLSPQELESMKKSFGVFLVVIAVIVSPLLAQ